MDYSGCLSAREQAVIRAMAEHINAEIYDRTGCPQCCPSVARLMTQTGLPDRTVQRARRKAQVVGIITAVSSQQGGRRKSVTFEFLLSWIDAALAKREANIAAKTPTRSSGFNAGETPTDLTGNPDRIDAETPTDLSGNPDKVVGGIVGRTAGVESLEEPLDAVSVAGASPTVPALPSFANAKDELKSSAASCRTGEAGLYDQPAWKQRVKQRWEQKVTTEVIQRYGPDEGFRIIESYQRGEPAGKRIFNLTDRAMRQNEPGSVSGGRK
jgi:hypothetical protein